jgi:tRNA threonylcarbamoyladenosine biosynthesis protein TsaB
LVEIDCFAAASGPGSFTGVRVGLSAVKGMAAALGKPAAGISNLRALASFGNLEPAIEARRGEVYTAVYDAELRLVSPEVIAPASGATLTEQPRNLAVAVAYCAELDGPAGWQDPDTLDANYVRLWKGA